MPRNSGCHSPPREGKMDSPLLAHTHFLYFTLVSCLKRHYKIRRYMEFRIVCLFLFLVFAQRSLAEGKSSTADSKSTSPKVTKWLPVFFKKNISNKPVYGSFCIYVQIRHSSAHCNMSYINLGAGLLSSSRKLRLL